MSHDISQSVPPLGPMGRLLLKGRKKEASERKMRKIAESKLSPTNSTDAVNYMKRNVEIASKM